jgi:hypothetical protein
VKIYPLYSKKKWIMAALPPGHVFALLLVKQAWHQEGFPMKMNGQSRTFVKQVKLDLLALCDSDLSRIIRQWVERSNLTEKSPEIAKETWLALGYTRTFADTDVLSQLDFDVSESEIEKPASWNAPEPEYLRTLLTAMDEQQFAQYVITLAFQTLHPIYPEWYDGLTFNAHLANYLRQYNVKRRSMTI